MDAMLVWTVSHGPRLLCRQSPTLQNQHKKQTSSQEPSQCPPCLQTETAPQAPRQDLTFASNETILLNRTARLRLFCSPEESEGLPLRRTHVEMARTGSAGLFGCGDDTDTADDSGMTDTDTDTASDEFEPRQTKAPSPFGRCMVTNS